MSEPGQKRRGLVLVVLFLVTAIVTVLGLYRVWHNYQTVGLGYDLAAETRRHRVLFDQNRRLRIELESQKRELLLRSVEQPLETMHVPGQDDTIVVPR